MSPASPLLAFPSMSVDLDEYKSWLLLSTFILRFTLTPGVVHLGRTGKLR